MYHKVVNNECSVMQLTFQVSPNASVFITTPKVGRTGINLAMSIHALMTLGFWVLNEQSKVFAQVVQAGQNKV